MGEHKHNPIAIWSKDKKVMKFKLGQLVATRTVADLMESSHEFAEFISNSLKRYVLCDWGDLDDNDRISNDNAVKNGDDRILAAYTLTVVNPIDHDADQKIWIITEGDRSMTTILFQSEY